MRVLECSAQLQGWHAILELIEEQLNCRSFLAEFDQNGAPTPKFGGDRQARQLGDVFQNIRMSSSRTALQFLIAEASLFHPYCKTSIDKRTNGCSPPPDALLGDSPDLSGAAPGGPEQHQIRLLSGAPGLVSPLRRTEKSTILFACLFTAHTPDTIDSAVASETFGTIVRALAPGLHTYLRLEQERSFIQIHRMLLSALGSPAVLINADRDILVQTPTALEMLQQLGLAGGSSLRLLIKNKDFENGLQALAEDHQRTTDSETPKERSIYLTDQDGTLKRISIETVAPPPSNSDGVASPFFLIRIAATAELSEDVESILHDHYDLSLSEAHLARYLTMTGSMNATAEHLGITRNTAKTHMRRIYEKTGVHTQLQLARLVHKLAGLF
ncbi:helix-turn-helix transcriptional regulator [uncultured Roseibium sp.]|uniref:helix-turn-helix transcriptional regulator n=1 Tax=uncultured Roseibium sp. TaxID=1936171 RepID=UPI002631F0E2|nr:helix-turn-helix transcriptional regulator [uncultured Roseibium sp.]